MKDKGLCLGAIKEQAKQYGDDEAKMTVIFKGNNQKVSMFRVGVNKAVVTILSSLAAKMPLRVEDFIKGKPCIEFQPKIFSGCFC